MAHIARHAVTPGEAEEALSDPERTARQTYSKDGEVRAAVTGLTYDERLPTVIVTLRPVQRVRVVTARDASRQERLDYQGEE